MLASNVNELAGTIKDLSRLAAATGIMTALGVALTSGCQIVKQGVMRAIVEFEQHRKEKKIAASKRRRQDAPPKRSTKVKLEPPSPQISWSLSDLSSDPPSESEDDE